jgi:hypothetical protein
VILQVIVHLLSIFGADIEVDAKWWTARNSEKYAVTGFHQLHIASDECLASQWRLYRELPLSSDDRH